MRQIRALTASFLAMIIPFRPNPCGVAPASLARLAPWERALLFAGDEADYWHTEEEPRGSNRGPRVSGFLQIAHTDDGQAWCAAMVYAMFKAAGAAPAIMTPAAVMSWVGWGKKAGAILAKPKRGCLFAFTAAGHTHIGFVTNASPDGTFQTIEGNSNDDGSREGYEVVGKTRHVGTTGLVFIDTTRIR